MKTCQRCGKKANRPRRLCWHCYYAPGVREQYTSGSKYSRRGIPSSGSARLSRIPTRHRPGTAEKVDVMVARAEAGESVFHPDDA